MTAFKSLSLLWIFYDILRLINLLESIPSPDPVIIHEEANHVCHSFSLLHWLDRDWIVAKSSFIDEWKDCFNKSITAVSTDCDEDGINFLKRGTNTYLSELRDLACSTNLSWKSKKCKDLSNKALSYKNSAANSNMEEPESVILPMFKIVTSYADWSKKAAGGDLAVTSAPLTTVSSTT